MRKATAGSVVVPDLEMTMQLLREVVAEGLDRALGAEVGTADADGDHQVHPLGFPVIADRLAIRNQAFRGFGRQVLPSQEVIAGTVSGDKHIESIQGLAHIRIILGSIHEAAATFYVNFYHDIFQILQNYAFGRDKTTTAPRESHARGRACSW